MEKFQHEMLCKALEIPRTASMVKVLQVLKISPIQDKLQKACLRYRSYIGPSTKDEPEVSTRATRSGRKLGCRLNPDIFTDRIRMIAENGELGKKSNSKTNKFSIAYAAKWAATQRTNISNRINMNGQN